TARGPPPGSGAGAHRSGGRSPPGAGRPRRPPEPGWSSDQSARASRDGRPEAVKWDREGDGRWVGGGGWTRGPPGAIQGKSPDEALTVRYSHLRSGDRLAGTAALVGMRRRAGTTA